ncbi:hypothetical protein PG985_003887 [Apiospora marii]|uniref:uncharacterized protein n=1 Tax=Apiospora marii TaxID=335849 RepID=UPI00313292D5
MSISLFLLGIWSLALGPVPLLVVAAGSSSCYKRDGTPQQVKKWLPCKPEDKASPCCDAGDFCMSNGLCLNAVGNQWFSAQGCTNPRWDSGCNEICNSTIRGEDGYGLVWYCDVVDSAGSVKYCCGPNADCCKQPNLQSIAIATALFKPPEAADALTSAPASVSASSVSASASASASSGGPTESANHSNNDDKNASSDNTRNLGIGLGVGIPMGLGLLGGIIFLGLQLRKWTAAAQQANAPTTDSGDIISQNVKERDVSTIHSQQLKQQPYIYPSELNGHEPQELYGGSRVIAS